jgi:acyl phosphate:glycerol-3-phosphate acyltransferase
MRSNHNVWLVVIGLVIVAYLLGAIPFGWLAGKLLKDIDIRDYGSGATGATNTLRLLGLKASIAVGLADFFKGIAAILLARFVLGGIAPDAIPYSDVGTALAAIVGHNWPIYVGFRGGRGVLTSLGSGMVFNAPFALAGLAAFGFTVWRTRYVSLGSMLGVLTALVLYVPAIFLGYMGWNMLVFAGVVGPMILIQHRGNIWRLIKGKEHRLGERVEVAQAHP